MFIIQIQNNSKGGYVHELIIVLLLFTDTTVRVKSPTEAEVEERERFTFWNVAIPKSGGIQGAGVHWRRVCIIRQGGANSDGL